MQIFYHLLQNINVFEFQYKQTIKQFLTN